MPLWFCQNFSTSVLDSTRYYKLEMPQRIISKFSPVVSCASEVNPIDFGQYPKSKMAAKAAILDFSANSDVCVSDHFHTKNFFPIIFFFHPPTQYFPGLVSAL